MLQWGNTREREGEKERETAKGGEAREARKDRENWLRGEKYSLE